MIENLLVFSTGLIGLVTIIQIVIRLRSNSITNIYLILIFSIIVLRFIVFGFFSFFDTEYLQNILANYNNFLIIIIPLTSLYFNNLVENKGKIYLSDTSHLIVPLLFFIVDYLDDVQMIQIPSKNLYFLCFFLMYLIFYIVSNYLILNKSIWSRKNPVSFLNKQNKIIRKWTMFLFSLMVLMGIRLVISLILEITSDNYSYGNSYMWVSSSIWLFIFFRILIFPEILNGYKYYNFDIAAQKNQIPLPTYWKKEIGYRITNSQDLQLEKKITDSIGDFMSSIDAAQRNSKLFRDPSITLRDLAYKLNIPKSHLTFLFKYYAKVSFSEYKKIVRIEDAITLIDKGFLKTNTFDSLAKEVGFASYNPFFTSFKEIIGVTPQEYFNRLDGLS
jgi:AraC-like DNA-binding protein